MEPFDPKDPAIAPFIIYVGHLRDIVDNDLLKTQFSKHGNIVGFQRTCQSFVFIKYDNTTSPFTAIDIEDEAILNGMKIMVKHAGQKGPNKKAAAAAAAAAEAAALAAAMDTSELPIDDCVIIVTSPELNEYAEKIEKKVKMLGFRVSCLIPESQDEMKVVLGRLQQKGHLYAILMYPINFEKTSLTLLKLYGEGDEHRDMPMNDALNLMYNDHCDKRDEAKKKAEELQRNSRGKILDFDIPTTKTSDNNESGPKKDCIILTKLEYKETVADIAAFLQSSGLSVGFMVHEHNDPMEAAVEVIHKKGHQTCILLLPEHIERDSLTLFIFQDKPEVHMNIKRIEALSFLEKLFAKTKKVEKDLSSADQEKFQVQILTALENFEKTRKG